MNDFLINAENVLKDLAEKYKPEGTDFKALVHQWVHALASGSELFAGKRGANKKSIIATLKKNDLYEDKESFENQVKNLSHIKPLKEPKFRFIDLFAGIGGMRIGFQDAGGQCVFSSEWDKYSQQTYLANFGEHPFGDITKISETDIPDHDVLVAGFPCQPFSHAGLKLGVDDTRGTLFYDIVRILEHKAPKFALLENVKGLVSHDNGYTLQLILKTLSSIGYRCNIDKDIIFNGKLSVLQAEAKQMVLRSVDFGVPQNRQRIYIALWNEKKMSMDEFTYPEPVQKKCCVGDILETKCNPKYTISDRLWEGHLRRKKENKLNGKGFGYGLVTEKSEYTNTISARYYKDGSEILLQQKNKNPRKITPKEASQLQGFPGGYIISKSDVQAYRQFGNSVTVPVVRSIAENISQNLG